MNNPSFYLASVMTQVVPEKPISDLAFAIAKRVFSEWDIICQDDDCPVLVERTGNHN